MTNDAPELLLVDDDPLILAFLRIHLESEGYRVTTAENGLRALDLIRPAPRRFGLVLSDVVMPEMNGYQLCAALREALETAHLPFIFISALTTLEEKMQGYALGGDDYIAKPIEPDVVVLKVRNIIRLASRETELSQQASECRRVAFQAMNYSGSIGQVLLFMQESAQLQTVEDIAALALSTVQSFGLDSAIQFHTPDGVFDYSSTGRSSPLESNIIELTRRRGRFFDFGPRTTINYKDFSMLVKNMPVDDPERYGQLKDLLGNLCNAIEARIQVVFAQKVGDKRVGIMRQVNQSLQDIESIFKGIQKANVEALELLLADVEQAMLTLGLSESQENKIRAIVGVCIKKTDAAFERSWSLDEKFSDIRATIDKAVM